METKHKTLADFKDEIHDILDYLNRVEITQEEAVEDIINLFSRLEKQNNELLSENERLRNEAHDQCLVNDDLETRACEAIIKAFDDGVKHGLTTTTGPVMSGKEYFDDSEFSFSESAELYASEENRKKDEPKQSDVEQMVSDYLHKELQTDNGDWAEWTESFVWKMVKDLFKSQQPVSIQWLSGEEIENISIKTYFKHERMSSDTRAIIQAERGAFVNGFNQAQSSLRNRVNAVDPVEFAEWIVWERYVPHGLPLRPGQNSKWHKQGDAKVITTSELLQIYINSKTKEHE